TPTKTKTPYWNLTNTATPFVEVVETPGRSAYDETPVGGGGVGSESLSSGAECCVLATATPWYTVTFSDIWEVEVDQKRKQVSVADPAADSVRVFDYHGNPITVISSLSNVYGLTLGPWPDSFLYAGLRSTGWIVR